MSTTTEPASNAPTLITLALDGEQRRAMDYHLRLLIDERARQLNIDAILALEPEGLLYMFRPCISLAESVKEIDTHTLTGTAGQLAEWIDAALADAEEAGADYEHPDDVARAKVRTSALAALSAQLQTAIADWNAL